MFDWISALVHQGGYFGIAALMFLENVFPPIPSELIMPMAGFVAAEGGFNLWLAIAAGSLGSLASTLLWYEIGRRFGAERLKRMTFRWGRLLTMTPDEVDRAVDWFARHGGLAVLIGRLVPGVRTLISVPAGMARMPLSRFLAYSALGTVAWGGVLALAGYLLQSQYDRVAGWVNPAANVVVVTIVLIYLYRLATFDRRLRRYSQPSAD
ncbi:DedA family protein [Acuticoccus sp. MNP-M23]|uniref:DedA family protein n=1 Tax=Acuticoccus sp. MNP-M23 TaxID=3072793 RepID=UPI00281522D2|nr:DedA family protein [Acuticoccus sp. MNP-M23]WMS41912.1 DedA family protein [Acuticoccus sp. MNP-M23]